MWYSLWHHQLSPLHSMPAVLASLLCYSMPGDGPPLGFCICFSLECFPLTWPCVFLPYLSYSFTQVCPSHWALLWHTVPKHATPAPKLSLFPFPTLVFLHDTYHLTYYILLIYIVYCLPHIKLLVPWVQGFLFSLLFFLELRTVPDPWDTLIKGL